MIGHAGGVSVFLGGFSSFEGAERMVFLDGFVRLGGQPLVRVSHLEAEVWVHRLGCTWVECVNQRGVLSL